MQQTSEDWKDVALTLSTASPLTGSAIPVLNTRYISLGRTRSYKSTFGSSFSSSRPPGTVFPTSGPGFPSSGYDATVGFKSAVASDGFVSNKSASQDLPFYSSGVHPLPSVAMPRRSRRSSSTSSIDGPQQDADQERTRRSRSRNRTVSPHEFVRVPLSGLATSRMVTATEGTISSTFDIEGLSTIPSDDSYHRVSIAVSLLLLCLCAIVRLRRIHCEFYTEPGSDRQFGVGVCPIRDSIRFPAMPSQKHQQLRVTRRFVSGVVIFFRSLTLLP